MSSPKVLGAVALLAAGAVQPLHAALTYPSCPALAASDFKEVVLVARGNPSGAPAALVTDPNMIEPVGLFVHTDGKVYWTERATTGNGAPATAVGRLRMFNPVGNTAKTLATFEVGTGVTTGQIGNREYGLRFFTLDPNYAQNKWGYVIYTPRTSASNRGVDTMYLSRFTLPTLDSLDMSSEKRLIKMPWTPGICCHQGGAMDWDAQGNLYFTTGNNVENSDNFGPMNDSLFANATGDPKDRATQDNQARPANTMDWRGKILRIKPDSSTRGYRIPAGNFRQRFHELGGAWVTGQDTNKILPEIYTVGHRNPYSLNVDKIKGWVAWGEVGPDQGSVDANRGPIGRDEFNLTTKPGFFGWPYFVGGNQAYNMWNPATNSYSLPKQNPDSVYNNSPNNTGVGRLPPARGAIIPEVRSGQDNSFSLGTGGASAVTGPIYRYSGALQSTKKLPPHFDGKWIIAEGIRHWVKVATLNDSGTSVSTVDDFPGTGTVIRPAGNTNGIEGMAMGPEGALYILHYAGAYFASSTSTRISRIEYQGSCLPTTPHSGDVSLRSADMLRNPSQGMFFLPGTTEAISWPEGMTRVEAYDLKGKRLFQAVRAPGASRVDMPSALRGSLVRVRFIP